MIFTLVDGKALDGQAAVGRSGQQKSLCSLQPRPIDRFWPKANKFSENAWEQRAEKNKNASCLNPLSFKFVNTIIKYLNVMKS